MIQTLLGRVSAGEDLSREEAARAIDAVIEGELSDDQIGILLMSLRAKGETVAEVAGAADALRKRMVAIRSRRRDLIDTCGTGGDRSGTFNISTAAALVTAASGLPVAKHGNRAVTSRSGSADVLAELGVHIEASREQVEACLETVGIGFCFAPTVHPAMRRVADVRRQLGVPTIFNLIGPLSNPARAPLQVVGVGRPELQPLLAGALAELGIRRAIVVWGEDGLDEVTIGGPTRVVEVGRGTAREIRWTPADFGLETAPLDGLRVAGPAESASVIRSVLGGEKGPCRDIVVLNAAAALWVADKAPDPRRAAELASDAIDRGEAERLLERLVETSHR